MALKPTDIRDVWHIVRTGLEELHDSSCQPWIPEDIYAAVVNRQAVLYMDRVSSPTGFVVVQSQECPMERVKKLLLWVAYDPKESSALRLAGECESIARDTGHSAVEFVTSIDKVGLLSEQFGYQKVSSLYRLNFQEK